MSFPDQENLLEQVVVGLELFMNTNKKTTTKVTKGLDSTFKICHYKNSNINSVQKSKMVPNKMHNLQTRLAQFSTDERTKKP